MDTDYLGKTARVIIGLRRSINLSMVSIILTIITTVFLYFNLIQDFFLPNDLTNPSIATTVSKSEFRSTYSNEFDRVNLYNQGIISEKPTTELIAFLPVNSALTLNAHYRLVSDKSNIDNDSAANHKEQLRYQPDFNLRINYPTLTLFLTFEFILIVLLFFIYKSKNNKYTKAHEERILESYHSRTYSFLEKNIIESNTLSEINSLLTILDNLHKFLLNLNRRYNDRDGFQINDEYDLQDLLYALLKIHFSNIVKEEYVSSKLESNSRVDFLLKDQGIAIETKFIKKNFKAKRLAEELLLDATRYSQHEGIKNIIFFIYDPESLISELSSDTVELLNKSSIDIMVKFSP